MPDTSRRVALAQAVAAQAGRFAAAEPSAQRAAVEADLPSLVEWIDELLRDHSALDADSPADLASVLRSLHNAVATQSVELAGAPLKVDFAGGWDTEGWPLRWETPNGEAPALPIGPAVELLSLVVQSALADYGALCASSGTRIAYPALLLHGWATAYRWGALAVGWDLPRVNWLGRQLTYRAVLASISVPHNRSLRGALDSSGSALATELPAAFIVAYADTQGSALWETPPPLTIAGVLEEAHRWEAWLRRSVTLSSSAVEHTLWTEELHIRRNKSWVPPLEVDSERGTQGLFVADDPAASALADIELAARLGAVSSRTREMLILDAAGYRAPEIAERLGATPASVRQRLSRARRIDHAGSRY